MKHIFKNRQGETIVEVLVSFLLLMIFTSMFVVSLRYARAMSQKAETLRETAYAFCAELYPAKNAAPNWVNERDGLAFSFGDYDEFTVNGVKLDSVETSAEVTENGQKTTEQHKFYRYSKSTAEGTTNP
jgi:Tfp pilus assembly protein PilV